MKLRASPFRCTFVLCAMSLFGVASANAIEDIKPPFGLIWGETPERLERLLKNAKATIIEKRKVEGGREAWDVEGLVQTGLKRTVFYFRPNGLCEVELQYQRQDWDQAKYDEYMGQIRRSIEKRFGPGQLIARKTEPEGDVIQTVVGYKWNYNNGAIELFYYSAQNAGNVFRTLSVHYKTD
jgi:hypothetical protein